MSLISQLTSRVCMPRPGRSGIAQSSKFKLRCDHVQLQTSLNVHTCPQARSFNTQRPIEMNDSNDSSHSIDINSLVNVILPLDLIKYDPFPSEISFDRLHHLIHDYLSKCDPSNNDNVIISLPPFLFRSARLFGTIDTRILELYMKAS